MRNYEIAKRKNWKPNKVCARTKSLHAAFGFFASRSSASTVETKRFAGAASHWLLNRSSRSPTNATSRRAAKSNEDSLSEVPPMMWRKYATDAMWTISSWCVLQLQFQPAVLLSLPLLPVMLVNQALPRNRTTSRREGDLRRRPVVSPKLLLRRRAPRTPESGSTVPAR